VTVGATLLPPTLRSEIEAAIHASGAAWSMFVSANAESPAPGARALAVKYVSSSWAATYKKPNQGLYIGNKNYTWGTGVYVTGVEEPLSTAIYGRVGLTARFDPAGWRAFDAREPANRDLYLRWLHAQADYHEAVLTVHSDHWLHEFRNLFREQFGIDVVLFRPDEMDVARWYATPTDTWLAVADWERPGRLAEGYSRRFLDARMTILLEEEFVADKPALTRSPQLVVSGSAPPAGLPGRIRAAYAGGAIERVQS
jgi:hypothetical protein